MYDVQYLVGEYTRYVLVGFGCALIVGFFSIALVALIHSFKSLAR